MEKVPMIAGSYEWECLECDESNTESWIPVIATSLGEVECRRCGEVFSCEGAVHCYEKV
jgi:hypothetical protein